MNIKETNIKLDSHPKKSIFSKSISSTILIVIIVISVTFFSLRSEDFLTLSNIITVIISVSTIGIVCIGQTLLLISGSFDISVGSVVGFAGVILAKVLENFGVVDLGESILAILIVIFVGAAIGFINGILVTKIGINALITTIAMLSIVIGLSMAITKGKYININTPFFIALGSYKIGNILPVSIIILIILYAGAYILLKTTVFGRYIYAIGNNETAAKYAGINVNRVRIILFVISSAVSSIAGIILASKLTSAQAIFGANYPLITIAACVLGGCLISGGKGGVLGSFLGISFVIIFRNGLVVNELPTHIQDLVTGIILIVALYISEFWVKKKA